METFHLGTALLDPSCAGGTLTSKLSVPPDLFARRVASNFFERECIMIRHVLLAALAVLVTATALVADDDLEVIKLTVTPAGPPKPLLRYRFAPEARQLAEGNAAAMYYRAIVVLQQDDRDRKKRQNIYDWLELPAAELPLAEARQTLGSFRNVLAETHLAGRRKRVEWDLPLAEQGVATLLPEIQEMRDLARLMTIDARLAILEGDYAKASLVLENMYTMGEHLGEAGTLVSMLVGLAVQGIANEEVVNWIVQPDSPNAYWALTSIPSSTDRLATSIESEDMWIRGSIPYADLLDQAILTPQQLEELAKKVGSLLDTKWDNLGLRVEFNSGEAQEVRMPSRVALLPLMLRAYPVCRRQLLESDVDRELIEAMDPMQVVMLRWVQVYRELLDEMVVWSRHRPLENRQALEEIDERFQNLAGRPEALLANLMLPAGNAASTAVLRLDQRIAMLRVVEAVRLYAAGHEGRLPATLDEIKEVPVPLDPATGGPFVYRLEGETAKLSSTARKIVIPDVQFEVTVAKAP